MRLPFSPSTGDPKILQSPALTVVALASQPAFTQVVVNVTRVVNNDDSVYVYFDPVPTVIDYRVYSLSNTKSVKYTGERIYNTDPNHYWDHIPKALDGFSIQVNGLGAAGSDIVVEAVDKLEPFQKMDGFMVLGGESGTSIYGQGDPSDIPNVIAHSPAFHVDS